MKAARPETAAVILAGGRSSRLFPFNKVLSDLTGSGRSLLQQTRDRLGSISKKSVYVLTTHEMVAPIQRQLRLAAGQILVDPVRKGTWPAILWAMVNLRQLGPDTVLAILPGDHAIQNDAAYRKAVSEAIARARERLAIEMIGITPGKDPEAWRALGCFRTDSEGRIMQFQEKPALEDAQNMLSEGGWFWNSGMFFFRISVAEEALRRFQPEMNRIYMAIADALARKKKEEAAALFERFPEKISHPSEPGRMVDNTIDYAVLTSLIGHPRRDLEARAIVHVGFRWTDLGQWSAMRELVKPDRHGNIRIGDVKIGPGVKQSILVADRGHRLEISQAHSLIVALSDNKALVLPIADIAKVKDLVKTSAVGQAIVGPPPYPSAFAWGKHGKVAVLSNQSKESL